MDPDSLPVSLSQIKRDAVTWRLEGGMRHGDGGYMNRKGVVSMATGKEGDMSARH